MDRPVFLVLLTTFLVLLLVEPALAGEDDTFPVGLGYAAITAATVAGGALAAAIRHLWKQNNTLTELHASQDDKTRTDNQKQKDLLRDRLELEQKERREESTALLREQQEIMREVMTTCGAISQALMELTKAVQEQTKAVQRCNTQEWEAEESEEEDS